jgi:short-subunit dehydrogenase
MIKDFLLNKNILITGATSGIGKSLTKYLSEHGANILMLSKDESKLDVLYDEIVKNIILIRVYLNVICRNLTKIVLKK